MARKKRMIAGFVMGLAAGLLLAPVLARPDGETDWDAWRDDFFEPLGLAVRHIERHYVDEVNPEDLLVGAYHGILSQLDQYSSYIPPERLEEFEGDTKGEFGGLGIQIRFYPLEKLLRVEQPIPGTPAFRAGVMAGDVITKVREHATGKVLDTSEFRDVHDAVRVLRGEVGTKVSITVLHERSHEEEEITIMRAVIKIPGVRAVRMQDEQYKIGYIYVASFHERTADDLRESIKKLQEAGLRGLVLDLRFNPGGLLSSAIDVSDMFLGDAVVVSTRGRASPEQVFRTRSDDILADAPVVVLLNRYSASASEIVAGAIKDNRRGLLVGETTFGKGSVQSILPLKNGESALKLTTAKYYTPSGVCIEKTGVEPHIKIEMTDQGRAVVENYLQNAGAEDYAGKARYAIFRYTEVELPSLDDIREKNKKDTLSEMDHLILKMEYESKQMAIKGE